MKRTIHICSFDSAGDIKGRKRIYDAVKARVIEAGRYSVFEATENMDNARLFMLIDKDPELETFRNPPGYPWIGVRRRVSQTPKSSDERSTCP